MDPRRLRELAGVARYRVAARAGVSDGNVRLYEASTGAVTMQVRQALDPIYAELRAGLLARLAELEPTGPTLGLAHGKVRA